MDGDAFYDEEFFYDAPMPAEKGNTMARIAMNIGKLTPPQLADKTDPSLVAIAAAPLIFTGATAVLAEGNGLVTALRTKDTTVAELLWALSEAREQRDQAFADLTVYYQKELVPYVTGVAKGSAEIIIAAAMDLARTGTPAPPMTKVLNVRLTPGSDSGTALAVWDVVYYMGSYEVQTSLTPEVEASWKAYKSAYVAKVGLAGQVSGQRCFVRVRACNNAGNGPWSDPVGCMIA